DYHCQSYDSSLSVLF
nr:immunoglobulin light chain junction region [Macaca mulatta]